MRRTKDTFAAKMAIVRNNLSFRKFAESIEAKTGVSISHSTLHDYENTANDIMPGTKNLEVLAQYAGVNQSWFLEESGLEYQRPHELLNDDAAVNAGEEVKAEYITDEFVLEVARVMATDGAVLNREKKAFLLNMIKTYVASVAKEARKETGEY